MELNLVEKKLKKREEKQKKKEVIEKDQGQEDLGVEISDALKLVSQVKNNLTHETITALINDEMISKIRNFAERAKDGQQK